MLTTSQVYLCSIQLDSKVRTWEDCMRSCLLMFMLMAIFVVGIGCEEIENLQKPQMNSENEPNVVEVTKVDEAPMLLGDETLLLLDDEPLLLLDDEPATEQSGQSSIRP